MLQLLNQLIFKFINYCYYFYRFLPIRKENKTVLITGASKGIGRELAINFAKERKTLVLAARNESLLNILKEELVASYDAKVYVVPFDVTEFDNYNEFLEKAAHVAGPIDTIVLNAGIGSGHSVGSKGAFDKDLSVLETNLLGPISCINEYVKYAKLNHIQDPHVVVITSVAADIARPYKGAYSASKAALSIYVESCALELESEGFWFTNIKPGIIKTEMTTAYGDSIKCSVEYAAKEMMFAIKYRFGSFYVPVMVYWPLTKVLYRFVPFQKAVVKWTQGKPKVQ